MFDLVVKRGRLPDGNVADIGIRRDRIAEVGRIEPSVMERAGRVIDADGDLVSPPFVDPHFHMDATLSYGLPRVNASGTLLEGIALWGELREIATVDEMVERALRYCDWAISMGLLAIRSHVDTSSDHLRGVEAMLEVRRQVAPYIDLQLVAFPQDGLYRSPTGRENLIRALDMGCDVVGGIPHFERTMADGAESVRDVARIAAERGLMLDIHCDETDDPMSRHVETLAAEVTRHGLGGRGGREVGQHDGIHTGQFGRARGHQAVVGFVIPLAQAVDRVVHEHGGKGGIRIPIGGIGGEFRFHRRHGGAESRQHADAAALFQRGGEHRLIGLHNGDRQVLGHPLYGGAEGRTRHQHAVRADKMGVPAERHEARDQLLGQRVRLLGPVHGQAVIEEVDGFRLRPVLRKSGMDRRHRHRRGMKKNDPWACHSSLRKHYCRGDRPAAA